MFRACCSVFTAGARKVVYRAIEEANELGHDCAGVEDVLLGLIGEEDGVAARVLRSQGVTGERVRARVLETGPPSAQRPSPEGPFPLPYTPEAKRVLERAVRESLRYGSRFVERSTSCWRWLESSRASRLGCCASWMSISANIRDAVPVPRSGLRTGSRGRTAPWGCVSIRSAVASARKAAASPPTSRGTWPARAAGRGLQTLDRSPGASGRRAVRDSRSRNRQAAVLVARGTSRETKR